MSKSYAFDMYPAEKWRILHETECHFYDEENTSFFAVGVETGLIITYASTICGAKIERTPIIHWMTLNEYNRLTKNSGDIIF